MQPFYEMVDHIMINSKFWLRHVHKILNASSVQATTGCVLFMLNVYCLHYLDFTNKSFPVGLKRWTYCSGSEILDVITASIQFRILSSITHSFCFIHIPQMQLELIKCLFLKDIYFVLIKICRVG